MMKQEFGRRESGKAKSLKKIFAHDKRNLHHFRTDAKHSNAVADSQSTLYSEEIAGSIAGAAENLSLGQRLGKASSMLRLIQYSQRKHPKTAHKKIDAFDENLIALTETQF